MKNGYPGAESGIIWVLKKNILKKYVKNVKIMTWVLMQLFLQKHGVYFCFYFKGISYQGIIHTAMRTY